MKRTLITLSGLIAAGLLAGCASKPATAAETKTPPKQQQQEEYVSQTSVGSWIPKKVKKSQAKTSDQESQDAQQAMAELQQRGNAQPPKGN
jgi:uncharacterized lipoprotein YajG